MYPLGVAVIGQLTDTDMVTVKEAELLGSNGWRTDLGGKFCSVMGT